MQREEFNVVKKKLEEMYNKLQGENHQLTTIERNHLQDVQWH